MRYWSFQGLGMLKIIVILTLLLFCLGLLNLLLIYISLILVYLGNDSHWLLVTVNDYTLRKLTQLTVSSDWIGNWRYLTCGAFFYLNYRQCRGYDLLFRFLILLFTFTLTPVFRVGYFRFTNFVHLNQILKLVFGYLWCRFLLSFAGTLLIIQCFDRDSSHLWAILGQIFLRLDENLIALLVIVHSFFWRLSKRGVLSLTELRLFLLALSRARRSSPILRTITSLPWRGDTSSWSSLLTERPLAVSSGAEGRLWV